MEYSAPYSPAQNGISERLNRTLLERARALLHAHKLLPKFVGPYEILEAHPEASAYTLKLPPDLQRRNVHAKFHVSRLRRHEPNDNTMFPHRDAGRFYNFGEDPDREYLIKMASASMYAGT